MTKNLTAKESRFVEEICLGKSQADAFRAAYGGTAAVHRGDNLGIAEQARRVIRRPHIADAIAARRTKTERRVEWTKAQALERLKQAADQKHHPVAIAAIAQASKMLGWDAPQKVEVKVEGSLLWQIRHKVRKPALNVTPGQFALVGPQAGEQEAVG